ncbi:hypothetical protein C5F50_05575 [Nitrosopumilus ureiphilus]|uniref:Uncharacterized protein n=2 Tax=Nitrosopumilus ureiphilus TaxID=1470067 RepID=A0A7D5R302_9ARCH|nr:hypothetical protein C5F50_05575 [Nitrosopumilus ureiphilus]
MDFNSDIRFAAVCDKQGEILWNSKRTGVKNMVPMEDTKKTLQRALGAWDERSKITDLVGKGIYVIAAYEKLKRITIPLDSKHILFISVDNVPLKDSKKKSYGHLVEMGKIMSIVDFVNSTN